MNKFLKECIVAERVGWVRLYEAISEKFTGVNIYGGKSEGALFECKDGYTDEFIDSVIDILSELTAGSVHQEIGICTSVSVETRWMGKSRILNYRYYITGKSKKCVPALLLTPVQKIKRCSMIRMRMLPQSRGFK